MTTISTIIPNTANHLSSNGSLLPRPIKYAFTFVTILKTIALDDIPMEQSRISIQHIMTTGTFPAISMNGKLTSLLLIIAVGVVAAEKYIATMSHCNVWTDPLYINSSMWCRGPKASIEYTILRTIQRMTVHVNMTAVEAAHKQDPYELSETFDYCQLTSGKILHPMIMIVYLRMLQMDSVRMIESCPVRPVSIAMG